MVKTTKIATIIFTTTSCLIWASAIPRQESALSIRDPPELLPQAIWGAVDASPLGHWFEKRKGGGGGGGSRGSGSSSSGSSSSGSSPGDSSGSGELLYNRCNQVKLAALMRNIGSRSGTSNTGGSSAGGSGAAPRYGPGGSSYKGGATTPYRAGATSPRGVAPLLLGGAALGFLAGSALVYGAYVYSLPNSVTYLNQTANQNQTSPVNCYCEQYQECSCDQLDDSGDEDNYVNGLIGDGSYQTLQNNNVTKTNNGSLYIDGTLDNGTTANNGSDTSSTAPSSSAGRGRMAILENAGSATLAAIFGSAVFLS